MDHIDQKLIEKKCFKHKNQNVCFLKINPVTIDCKLICSLCLNMAEGQCYIFDINQILNQKNQILHYWPFVKNKNDFDEAFEILSDLESQQQLIKVRDQIKQLRCIFDYEIEQFEQRLTDLSIDKTLEKFYAKYKQAAQLEQFSTLLKQELNQRIQEQNISEKMQKFIQEQNQNNKFEDLFQDLKDFQQKYDHNLTKLNQISKLLAIIFKNPFDIKQLSEQIILSNIEDKNSKESKEKDYMPQRKFLLEKQHMQEQNLELNENSALVQNLNDIQKKLNISEQNFHNLKEKYLNEGETLINYLDSCFQQQSNKFNLHPHSLKLTTNSQMINQSVCCNSCGLSDILFSWHCSECKFDLCLFCSQKKKFPQHNHQLQLTSKPQRKYEGSTKCQICKDDNIFFSWNCSQCAFDICQKCNQNQQEQDKQSQEKMQEKFIRNIFKGQKRYLSLHLHELKPTLSQQRTYTNSSICNVCNKDHIEFAWHCSQCKFDVCQKCSDKFKKFPQHLHELKLTNKEQRQYTGITVCDICDSLNLEYTWHCSLSAQKKYFF
ncbi:hypothetical protein ABPG73_013198 [Tetrahymena malaccensis]